MVRPVTLLVCGEPLRGDDGVASAVVEHLPSITHAFLVVEHVGQLTPDHLLAADEPVLLLDAVDGPPPGEIVDLPLGALTEASGAGMTPASSHGLSLRASIDIVERLRGASVEGRFIGVASADYRLGAPLSTAVRDAVPRCAERVSHWVWVLAHETGIPACA